LKPLEKRIIPQSEQKILSQQVEKNQFHHDLKIDGVAITNKARGLGEVSDIDVDDELSFVVDQLKEIALRVGGRKCVMIAQIT
jgi:hypothetical protein